MWTPVGLFIKIIELGKPSNQFNCRFCLCPLVWHYNFLKFRAIPGKCWVYWWKVKYRTLLLAFLLGCDVRWRLELNYREHISQTFVMVIFPGQKYFYGSHVASSSDSVCRAMGLSKKSPKNVSCPAHILTLLRFKFFFRGTFEFVHHVFSLLHLYYFFRYIWVTIACDSNPTIHPILWCNSARFVQDTYGDRSAQVQQNWA